MKTIHTLKIDYIVLKNSFALNSAPLHTAMRGNTVLLMDDGRYQEYMLNIQYPVSLLYIPFR